MQYIARAILVNGSKQVKKSKVMNAKELSSQETLVSNFEDRVRKVGLFYLGQLNSKKKIEIKCTTRVTGESLINMKN